MKKAICKILVAVMVISTVMIPADIGLSVKSADQSVKVYAAAKTGWQTTSAGKKYIYKDGSAAKGYKKIGSYYYYFNSKGIMQKYSQKINGKPYYFHGTGKGAAKGWITFKDGTKKYCSGNGKLLTGYQKVSKNHYYFDSNGVMKKYSQIINGKPYYFHTNGKGAATGWINFKDGTKKRCVGHGKLLTGYQKVDNYYYYFDSNGVMKKYSQIINGRPYYFHGNGKGAAKGWINFNTGGKKYSLGNGKLAVGKVSIGGQYYYFDSDGYYSPYIITSIPSTSATEATIFGRDYKAFTQYARNYKGYNSYLASHGCSVCSLTTILRSFAPACYSWTPYETITKAEKTVAGTTTFNKNYSKAAAKQMPISMYGNSKVLTKYGVSHKYISTFKSDATVKSDISTHLKSGQPVMFIVSKTNRATGKQDTKWTNSYHTMIMAGITADDKVLVINPAGPSRFHLAPLDEMINYMFTCTTTPNSFYFYGKARSGGYIKIYE